MEKFKVGDTVRLKDGLEDNVVYGRLTLLPGMVFKNTAIVEFVDDDHSLTLETDKDYHYYYDFDMLELTDGASEYQGCQEK